MSDLDMLAASRTNSNSKSVSAEAELKPFDEVTDFPRYCQYNTGSRTAIMEYECKIINCNPSVSASAVHEASR